MPAVLWGSAEQSSRSPAGFAPDVRGLASLSLPIHISAGNQRRKIPVTPVLLVYEDDTCPSCTIGRVNLDVPRFPPRSRESGTCETFARGRGGPETESCEGELSGASITNTTRARKTRSRYPGAPESGWGSQALKLARLPGRAPGAPSGSSRRPRPPAPVPPPAALRARESSRPRGFSPLALCAGGLGGGDSGREARGGRRGRGAWPRVGVGGDGERGAAGRRALAAAAAARSRRGSGRSSRQLRRELRCGSGSGAPGPLLPASPLRPRAPAVAAASRAPLLAAPAPAGARRALRRPRPGGRLGPGGSAGRGRARGQRLVERSVAGGGKGAWAS
uniref:Uncharacterized protein n=1 Tax=Rangifer tarandus platyrhynchus TaxID=3082113 RepID=A0ACB0EYX8_RANTA|nr:unnamed protein product [Rangifer tarandus platyrhynchus]